MNILAFPRALMGPQLAQATIAYDITTQPSLSVYKPRAELETDAYYLQLIPYAVLQHQDGRVWAYQRTGGDGRVKGRHSIGVGGHVDESDQHAEGVLHTARNALIRELREELQNPPEQIPALPVGWINEQISEIGRVHIGLVWLIPWLDPQEPLPAQGEALEAVGFQPLASVVESNGYELWSQLACDLIQEAKA